MFKMCLLLVPILLIQSLASARAQLLSVCPNNREFAVDDCTACLTKDTSRDDVTMAECEPRPPNKSVCVCGSFPANFQFSILVYYPQIVGNVSQCASDSTIIPNGYIGLRLVAIGLLLYAVSHLVYILCLSGMCSCKRHRCTKTNSSALFFVIAATAAVVNSVCALAGPSLTGYNHILEVLFVFHQASAYIARAFWYSSVSDMAWPDDDMISTRRCINVLHLIVAIMSATLEICSITLAHSVKELAQRFLALLLIATVIAVVYNVMFMIIAQRKMRQVSSLRTRLCAAYAIFSLFPPIGQDVSDPTRR